MSRERIKRALRSCNGVVKKDKAAFVEAGLVLDEHIK